MNKLTLRKFVNDNYTNKENNILNWNSYYNSTMGDYFTNLPTTKLRYTLSLDNNISIFKVDKYNKNESLLYNTFRNHDSRQYERLETYRWVNRIELTISEAIETMLDLDIYYFPEHIKKQIKDINNEDDIIKFVENYYKTIGPMIEIDGNLII